MGYFARPILMVLCDLLCNLSIKKGGRDDGDYLCLVFAGERHPRTKGGLSRDMCPALCGGNEKDG